MIMYEPASFGAPPLRSDDGDGGGGDGNGGGGVGGNGGGGGGNGGRNGGGGAVRRQPATDVLCPMYARVEECRAMAAARPIAPLILCEYSHAMGNSCGGLHR
jgi:Glycosyl hydrolases family 2, TIM barrel domain